MADLNELIERVKAATGPDRYVDCHLWVLGQGGDARMRVCDSSMQDFVWERGIGGFWVRSVVKFRAVPKYTASIDAALALVERMLSGWRYDIHSPRFGVPFEAVLMDGDSASRRIVVAKAATAPIALVCALLSALSPNNGEGV